MTGIVDPGHQPWSLNMRMSLIGTVRWLAVAAVSWAAPDMMVPGAEACAQSSPLPATQPAPAPSEQPEQADEAGEMAPPVTEEAEPVPADAQPEAEKDLDPIVRLHQQIAALEREIQQMRQQMAEAVIRAAGANRELDELRQFIADHQEYGNDFAQYKAVKEQAEREAKRKETEAARAKRDAARADRDAKVRVARAQKAARDAQLQKAARYRRSGFTPLGLEVYSGKWAFYYETTDTTRSRIDYTPGIGNYVRLYPNKTIDYGKMTISGSVLNGSDEVRNVGVAITFFDEHGNQVGQETVQVSNARPDVPYPFTSKIDMALDRPFDTSSTYVLYADPVDDEAATDPSTTTTMTTPPGSTPQTPATKPYQR